MIVSPPRPILFLDVDGPLIPFGATKEQYPNGYPTFSTVEVGANPLLARVDPALGSKLLALPCDLVWATTWESEANECLAPLLGLPQLPVVTWPEPSEEPEPCALHWKTRTLLGWAAGRPFAWLDDEITDADRTWAEAHHPSRTFLHRVDHRHGLTAPDFAALEKWLRGA
ncbi:MULTISPECIES: HAD domain-containing protein [unclassified Streptomyces]|uniref:HAD domain-containing protein n=1 Tax=unclassified Streptomyces TaxID=2593676 RepID=UPI000B8818C5|nr:HAD domain-containing protein [Streptomyces sp. DvalAA-14]